MASILLSRLLVRSFAARCVKYGSYLGILEAPRAHWREMATRNHTECPVYKTRLALPVDYDRVMCFMCDAFFKHDATLVGLGLNVYEPAPPLLKMLYDEVCEGMTIIAENEQEDIIGTVVNAGACPWDPDKLAAFARCERAGPVRDMIEFESYVTRRPDLWRHYHVLKIFDCSYIAVGMNFRNHGIARKLVLDSWYLARDCGYRLFRLDSTSRYVSRIAENFGWKRVCTIPYNQYVRNGELVFKCIREPHTEVHVFIDRVTYCKDYCPTYTKCERITQAPKIK